ncbi:GntR family transcriptional regulator [Arthrobacter crystallopoietes BAB-32]|uniref:GntR family transcriptional regulator n=1 Tax=Arthrobacter crystallopoietes BAB-32 TaxID=1246476 RepID=N1V6G2_9MICC|nr:GntR family transcriptional regulator [Arthrobacter crystallopoietes]EMY35692.1 GntR family transcriptional regulator [Arthrobacter crystallopoietes BAB-32]
MLQNPVQATAPTVLKVHRPSTVDLIAAELRKAIYSGALQVRAPLREVEIAGQLGVSRSPLREAAQRLVQEGLLTAHPGQGLRVAYVDEDRLDDLFEARIAVESHAARMIIDRNDDDAIAAVEKALARLKEAAEGDDARAIGDADLDFHLALVQAAGNAHLTQYMSTLVIETRLASYSSKEGYVVRRDVTPTYHAIVDALKAGDGDAAADAIREQLAAAVDRLTGKLAERGVEVDTVAEEAKPADGYSLGPIGQ